MKPLLTLALLLAASAAAAEDPASQRLLDDLRGKEWKHDKPKVFSWNWVEVSFQDESSASRTLAFNRYNLGATQGNIDAEKDPAKRQSNLALFRLFDKTMIDGGWVPSYKSALSSYYVISFEPLHGNSFTSGPSFTALIGRRDKPALRILGHGTFPDYTKPTSPGEMAIAMPRKVDSSPNSPVTALLEERTPAVIYPDRTLNVQYPVLCADKNLVFVQPAGGPIEFGAPQSGDPVHSLFSRAEDIVLTALAPAGSTSLVESRVSQRAGGIGSLNGADLGKFVSDLRRDLQPSAAELKGKLAANSPSDYFLPEESRLIQCYVRFLGPAAETLYRGGLAQVAAAAGDGAAARTGFVSFWRPAAVALLEQAARDGAGISEGTIVLGRDWHSGNDAKMRKGGHEAVAKSQAVGDWAAYKPAPPPAAPPRQPLANEDALRRVLGTDD